MMKNTDTDEGVEDRQTEALSDKKTERVKSKRVMGSQ